MQPERAVMAEQKRGSPEEVGGVEEPRATFISTPDEVRNETPEQRRARLLAIADDFMDRHDAAFRALAR